jgi:hypothetical protein
MGNSDKLQSLLGEDCVSSISNVIKFMLQRTIDKSEETLEQKEQELVFLHRHQQNIIREQQ